MNVTVDSPDENQLFQAIASGGAAAEAALRQIYDRYARRLFGLLRSKGYSTDEAEEILQEAFLKLFRSADQVATVDSPKAYLYQTVINCGYDLLRRKRRISGETPLNNEALVRFTERNEATDCDAYDGFLDCLSVAYARFEQEAPERGLVIRLAVIEGMSGSEVAAAIGRSYGASREFLSQTRKKFQALLLELCGDYVLPEA